MTKRVRIGIDEENNAEVWWDAARADHHAPAAIRPLLYGTPGEVAVSKHEAVTILRWAKSLPGWADGPKYAPTALLFAGITTTRRPRRYRVTSDDVNRATLLMADGTMMRFWSPPNGGYVRQVTESRPGVLGQQITDGRGNCVEHSVKHGPLADVIRKWARHAFQERDDA